MDQLSARLQPPCYGEKCIKGNPPKQVLLQASEHERSAQQSLSCRFQSMKPRGAGRRLCWRLGTTRWASTALAPSRTPQEVLGLSCTLPATDSGHCLISRCLADGGGTHRVFQLGGSAWWVKGSPSTTDQAVTAAHTEVRMGVRRHASLKGTRGPHVTPCGGLTWELLAVVSGCCLNLCFFGEVLYEHTI